MANAPKRTELNLCRDFESCGTKVWAHRGVDIKVRYQFGRSFTEPFRYRLSYVTRGRGLVEEGRKHRTETTRVLLENASLPTPIRSSPYPASRRKGRRGPFNEKPLEVWAGVCQQQIGRLWRQTSVSPLPSGVRSAATLYKGCEWCRCRKFLKN